MGDGEMRIFRSQIVYKLNKGIYGILCVLVYEGVRRWTASAKKNTKEKS